MDKRKLKASVVTISFSAHTDFNQTNGFIQRVNPNHIYLVHGERTNVKKLHDEFRKLYTNLTVYYLVNGRDFSNRLSSTREASIIGSLRHYLRRWFCCCSSSFASSNTDNSCCTW